VSQGRGKDSLTASLVVSLTTIAAFLAGMPFGIAGVAIFYSVSGLLIQIPALYYITGREGPVRTRDLWISLLWHLPVWGIVTTVAWLVRQRLLGDVPLIQLIVAGGAGFIAGVAFIGIWPRSRQVALRLADIIRQLAVSRGFDLDKVRI
jgi:PST family polysaccharide transporter